ncbi:disease resistance protein RGA2-like [Cornus florida]|uniref:disease resistance protein RGA2-like n=1 Tax=Cornus florida TaxID=4283 RepID=UPI0028A074B4|nr:disease resistance protein RGA2-like [Cornus florida]XP_059657043.1 disease resistance protein RGA2-like [Cornus florida]XP_059657044.1 disease resistance protein RGA2-like [Cornus florida]XP_059657045.1 disease resistance protein RGA2-like [Cornus florida]XP_059657046.1 disease resistance protein RGA2-like [Cornus florida]XP_059657048.1 disease resistance protein RGA2-like [Cornus florida]XP_059657049.1 disease resistance protein RGA2-like [Cornus florida]XP_059657050.1 disease resistanc
MAEGALLQVVLDNLNSLIQGEIGLLWGVDKEMQKLSNTLSTIRTVLEDAELRQLQDRAIKNWLRKLKQATYDIDDVLDECATEAARLKESKRQTLDKVRGCFLSCYSPLDNVLFRRKIGNKMKEINEKLNAIAEERSKFHLHDAVVANRVGIPEWRETSSFLTEPHVYGREDDKESILEQLVKHTSDSENVSILPIVGIGGLGKTTLAQLVLNDKRVIEHFEPRIWVCVSDDFDVKRIIESIIGTTSGGSNLDHLQRQLQEKLNGKRYFLVLDDVWNDNQEKWDKLKCILACGSKGSSVIITTRLENVASIMATLPIYRLSSMSEDDCWLLFKQRAFKHESEESPNLVTIGKEIVKKCGGVPLAAKALGSLMRFKNEESEWLHVKESQIWNLPQDEKYSVLPALRLSYHNLPLECRQCFAYCSIFVKDSRIMKDRMIHLWMANGFISSNGIMELEDVGNKIWNELYWRSFFQEVESDDYGNRSFKMHDLVHDLAQSIMEDECYVMEVERSNNKQIMSGSALHVTSVTDSKVLENVESMRTLFVNVFPRDFMKFYALRVLDARGLGIDEVPSSIGNLIHLRYLNLSSNGFTKLPKSLCTLLNLQTLNLNNCWGLQRLPKHTRRLTNLRHLFIGSCNSLKQMAPKIGQLTYLKTLSVFIVDDRRRGFQLGELRGLKLGGELRIQNLERVENWMDASEANLIGKQNLYSLGFHWGRRGVESEILRENAERVLEALEPNPNLKELVIQRYRGASFPLWMREPVLQNLVTVSLLDCENCQNFPSYGRLRFLKHLKISGMKDVKYIDDDSHGGSTIRKFPSLERLHISCLPCLERLSREEENDVFPCLSRLYVHDCPKLTFSCLPSIKDLEVWKGGEVLLSSISGLNCLTSLQILFGEQSFFPEGMLRKLTSLQSLSILNCEKLGELPNELSNLGALNSLVIRHCGELESLPEQGLQGLNSLRSLELRSCKKLKSLSEGLQHLTALESLALYECPELVSLPENGIRHLHSLRNLHIAFNPNLVVLPEALQHVPALQSLRISGCGELTSLPDWLGNLASLQRLEIWFCPKVVSLPDSTQSLTNLTTLVIRGCGEQLKRRCEKGRGEDWYKIQRIPDVRIYAWDRIAHITNCCSQWERYKH